MNKLDAIRDVYARYIEEHSDFYISTFLDYIEALFNQTQYSIEDIDVFSKVMEFYSLNEKDDGVLITEEL